MKYNQLSVNKHRRIKRVGRGISAGQGKTAGRGTKGQKSRAGSSKRPGFAGGQNPLMQQLPKLPGFKSHRVKSENVYTSQLSNLKESKITAETLAKAGMISSPYVYVKLLFNDELDKKINVALPAASAKAIEAIQSAGGNFEMTDRIARTAKAKEEK